MKRTKREEVCIFVKQIMKGKFSAADVPDMDVTCTDLAKGNFSVWNSTLIIREHTVNFGTPSCYCKMWEKFPLSMKKQLLS